MLKNVFACILASALLGGAAAQAAVLDFEFDESGAPMVDGQIIDPAFDGGYLEFGTKVAITSTVTGGGNGHLGATIFDSDPPVSAPDPDLEVNLGNILILQADENPATAPLGTGLKYVTPNDEATNNDRGEIVFDFLAHPVKPLSIDIIDIDGGASAIVTLVDVDGDTRKFSVPKNWTSDINAGGTIGFNTLKLDTLAPQAAAADATGGPATHTGDVGAFDLHKVEQIRVEIFGSGAIDNLAYVPEPASLALMGLGGLALIRRR